MARINEKVLRDIARGDRDCDRVGLRRLALDLLDARARVAELEAAEEDDIALPPGVRPTSVSEQMALERVAELETENARLLAFESRVTEACRESPGPCICGYHLSATMKGGRDG